jgi:hypothetical protein
MPKVRLGAKTQVSLEAPLASAGEVSVLLLNAGQSGLNCEYFALKLSKLVRNQEFMGFNCSAISPNY